MDKSGLGQSVHRKQRPFPGSLLTWASVQGQRQVLLRSSVDADLGDSIKRIKVLIMNNGNTGLLIYPPKSIVSEKQNEMGFMAFPWLLHLLGTWLAMARHTP